MMKKTLFPIVLITALLTVISCSKSFESSVENTDIQVPVFTATIDNGDSKTTLGGNESNRTVLWTTNDLVDINGATYKAETGGGTTTTFKYVSGTKPTSGPYTAYYPATLSNLTLPASYNFTDAASSFNVNPMHATSTSTSLSFRNICSVLKITVPQTAGLSVSSIVVSSPDKVLNGEFTISNNTATMSKTSGFIDDDRKVTLGFSTAVSVESSSAVFYVIIPAQEYTTLKIVVNGSLTMVKTVNKALSRSKIYTLSFTPESGWFSIGSNKTVKFSSGNLQAYVGGLDGNPTSWRFAPNQYDYVGNSVANTKIAETAGYVDLFGWSTDAIYNKYGIHTKISSTTDYTTGNFNDWGKNADLQSSLGTGWYTLSTDQWKYILNTSGSSGRTDAYRFAMAAINNDLSTYNGLLIFPNGYTGTTSGNGIATINSTSVEFPSTYITADDWLSMEAAGCVFLPVTGFRFGSDVSNVNSGYYWSSTPSGENQAYFQYFGNYYFNVNNDNRYYGRSVRLVRE